MREIKFRAWDKTQLRMVTLNAWHFDTGLIDASAPEELRGFRNDGRYEVMQFTGLKDKNGKEIYEGDIVKALFHYGDDYGNEVGESEERIGQVSWTHSKGRQFVGFDFFPANDLAESIEVIGNIYENPELLKA
jgi:uncharacterized phage protein (TIGR01671 family)